MNKSDLKKFSKLEFIKLLLKKEKKKFEIIVVDDIKLNERIIFKLRIYKLGLIFCKSVN